jgi:hypothetical protein
MAMSARGTLSCLMTLPMNPPLNVLRDLDRVRVRDLERVRVRVLARVRPGMLYYSVIFLSLSSPPHHEQDQYGEHHDEHENIDGQEHVYVRVHDVDQHGDDGF